MSRYHLVIARYNEDVDWLSQFQGQHDVFLYNKGPSLSEQFYNTVELLNYGRESHSYLKHIIDFYEELPPWTIFSQANPFDHCANFADILRASDISQMRALNLLNGAENPLNSGHFVSFGHYWLFDLHKFKEPWENRTKAIEWFRRWWLFPDKLPNTEGAIFAVSSAGLRLRSKSFYQDLLDLHRETYLLPWVLEYLWPTLFEVDEDGALRYAFDRVPRILHL